MTTGIAGPLALYGQDTVGANASEPCPSLLTAFGVCMLDTRPGLNYVPGQNIGSPFYGFYGDDNICTLDITPVALSATAVAAAAVVTSGVAMTLVAASGSGVVVGASTTNRATGNAVSGLLAIGQASGVKAFPNGLNVYDPTTMTARALSITAAAGTTGGNFTVTGFDIYGYPMTEVITSVTASTVSGRKAWKYISAVTPNFTDTTGGHTYSVGTTDIFGFPIFANAIQYETILYPDPTQIAAITGFVAGLALSSTSTSITADVRGTYALQAASNGTNRLTVFQNIAISSIAQATYAAAITGIFGVNQA